MKKILNFIKEKKIAVSALAFSLMILPVNSFATDGSTGAVDVDTTVLINALTSIATNIKNVVTSIAPIALGVTAVFLIWKYGLKFFKGLVK